MSMFCFSCWRQSWPPLTQNPWPRPRSPPPGCMSCPFALPLNPGTKTRSDARSVSLRVETLGSWLDSLFAVLCSRLKSALCDQQLVLFWLKMYVKMEVVCSRPTTKTSKLQVRFTHILWQRTYTHSHRGVYGRLTPFMRSHTHTLAAKKDLGARKTIKFEAFIWAYLWLYLKRWRACVR